MLSRSPVKFTAIEYCEHIQIFQISNELQVPRFLQTHIRIQILYVCLLYVYIHALHVVGVCECVFVFVCGTFDCPLLEQYNPERRKTK